MYLSMSVDAEAKGYCESGCKNKMPSPDGRKAAIGPEREGR